MDTDDLKVPPRSAVTPENICVLDLLNVRKPLPDSCLSEEQVETLFALWREFVFLRFKNGESDAQAAAEVDQLYSQANTFKRKYNALRMDQASGVNGLPALAAESEQSWIVGGATPTPFIRFVQQRPDIMDQLRMSFKPRLMHPAVIEAPDLLAVLGRYAYWLAADKSRAVNVLGVTDDTSQTGFGITAEQMAKSLRENWGNARFHVALLREDVQWRAVLIDRKARTFEYYDPLGHSLDLNNRASLLAENVNTLYEIAREREPEIITRAMHSVRRGFHKHQSGGNECAMYVILFFHTRVALLRTFEEFEQTEIKQDSCRELKGLFFLLPEQFKVGVGSNAELSNLDFRSKFVAYDIRLAALDFIGYVSYVIALITDGAVKNSLSSKASAFSSLITSPADHSTLRIEGMRLQQDVLLALPPQFKSYAGSEVWHSYTQEIVQDPLTKYLRQISSTNGSRSKNTLRKQIALKFYNDIAGWSLNISSPPEATKALNDYCRAALDNYYIRILHFDADNHRKFEVGMPATAFVRECMNRQETVSFGVHFLRRLAAQIINVMKIPVQSELLTRFAQLSQVVVPVASSNLEEIRQLMTRCDQLVKQGYDFLQNVFREQIGAGQVSPSPAAVPKMAPMAPMAPVGPSPNVVLAPTTNQSYDVLSQIVERNVMDLKEQLKDLNLNQPHPWNMPLDVSDFETTQNVVLPAEFKIYSVTHFDKQKLLANSDFFDHYVIVLSLFEDQLEKNYIREELAARIALVSAYQFFLAAQPETQQRAVICFLLARLHKTMRIKMPALRSLLDSAQRFVDSCSTVSKAGVAQTMQRIVALQSHYASRALRGGF